MIFKIMKITISATATLQYGRGYSFQIIYYNILNINPVFHYFVY